MTALLLTATSSPSAPTSERRVAARAIPGEMLVTPKPDALIKRSRARVALRVPSGTRRLLVRLEGRTITARFRRSGSLRVATLSRRHGLRYGRNSLYVRAARGGRRPLVEARSFVVARRVQGLARLKMNRGPVTSVDIRVAAPRLTPDVFDSRREVERRLAVIRRPRRVRIRLNGRPVTGAFARPQPTRWKTSLSATHGLRYGVNRLRVQVVERETGRYDVLRRRFVVPRGRPLPAAGSDLARPLGGDRMPLHAHDSRNGDGGRLSYRWRILSKPRGSDPTLRRPGSATPLFDPDRRGRYRLGLQVTDPTDPRAAQTSRSSMDVMDSIVGPSQMLVPFGFVPNLGGVQGITVGGQRYPAEDGRGIQWLTLDRATLKPSKTGNTVIDPYGRGGWGGLDTLAKALAKGGHGDLVILTYQLSYPSYEAPVKRSQVAQFNSILKLLGVGPIDANSLTRPNQQLVVVGVPYGGDGSGYYSQVFDTAKPVLNGWLMPDSVQAAPGVPNFRFQPEKVKFDTSGENQNNNVNVMQLGAQSVGRQIDSGASGGFQVVAIDPNTFQPVDVNGDNQGFQTNYDFNNADVEADVALKSRQGMAQYLRELAKRKVLVAVQSIGHVNAAPPPNTTDQQKNDLAKAWRDLDEAMQGLGANPHTFYTADGSYAFIGGSGLTRSEMVDSSSAIQTDPTRDPPLRESGTLQGLASIRSDGLMRPAVADGSDRLEFKMYDYAFQAPTPWPHTDPGDPEADEYRRALAYTSLCLPDFNPPDPKDKGWGPDLRSAYAGNLSLNYTAARIDLDKLPYPGDGARDCERWDYTKEPGFTRDQYSQLSAELETEFRWLDSVERLFGDAQTALSRSGGQQQVDLKSLGDHIKNTIKPPSNAAKIAEDIGEFFLLLFEDLALIPESVATLGFVEFVAAVYQISTSLASDADTGNPLGDKIDKEVGELSDEAANRLSASASGLDRLRQVIISDYGRLRALGTVANTPAYSSDVPTMTARMNQAANGWFSSTLLPIVYGVNALEQIDIAKGKVTADNCYITKPAGFLFYQAPATAQLEFFGKFERDGFVGKFPTPFVLAYHDLVRPRSYPPADVTNMFLPVSQGGYGLQLQRYVWEQYKPSFPPTDIAKCN